MIFNHKSVLLNETVDSLCVKPQGIYVDGTLGGGALAYGHPYGVSGAMILLHLMKALEYKNGHLGMCCVAAAGGIGSSILVEKVMK